MVRVELGAPTFTVDEAAQVNQWLGRIERVIRDRIPDLDQRIDDGDLSAETVADVEVAAVARKAGNPGGLRQRSTTITGDDVSETTSETIDSALSDGQLRLTDDEWARLEPATGGAFTIRLGRRAPCSP
jgi:hypothetical protein